MLLPEASANASAEGPSHHLALQLTNAKAQLRRLRQEVEEKAELLLDSQAEVQGLESEIRRLRQEVRSNAHPPPLPLIDPSPLWSYCFL